MKRIQILLICALLAFSLYGCGSSGSASSAVPASSAPPASSTTTSSQTASSVKRLSVDWDKCFAELKPHVMGGDYDYVRDVYIKVDDSKKLITLTAVFGDATKPELAPKYADMVMRQFNTMAQMQDSSIKGGSKDYRGGIYDEYQTQIGIAPVSKQEDTSKWYVFDTVPALAQTHKIELQKPYR